jgi:hypothetical protein
MIEIDGGEYIIEAFEIIKKLTDFNSFEGVRETFKSLAEKSEASGEQAKELFMSELPYVASLISSQEDFRVWADLWIKFNNLTTDYNRETIMSLFGKDPYTEEYILNWIKLQGGDPIYHFNFYLQLIEQNSRLALQILQGVLTAVRKGTVSVDLSEDEKMRILGFIKMTKGFNPYLYRVFVQEGEAPVAEFLALSEKILRDDLGPEVLVNYQAELKKRGYKQRGFNLAEEIILAVIQSVIPASGASFVKKGSVKRLFKQYLSAGDRRKDVPISLRGYSLGGGEIQRIEWHVMENEVLDEEGRVRDILLSLRYPEKEDFNEGNQQARQDKQLFIKELNGYIQNKNEDTRAKALKAFYRYVRHNDLLREKIEQIQLGDYTSFNLLEQLFLDKDNLSVLLQEILTQDIDPELLTQKGTDTIRNAEAVKGQIERIWSNPQLDEDQRNIALERVLARFDRQNIEMVLLPLLTENLSLSEAVSDILSGELRRKISVNKLIREFFEEPIKIIQAEKAKFESKVDEEKIRLTFRAVKSVPYGLWGLCAGVCVANDIKMWQDPNFYLLAMIDETANQAVGFIHLYQTEINGEKVLTVPGIEPSTEFLGQVDAKTIYPMIEGALREIAQKAGYTAIYLPTSEKILSNRVDINRIAKRKGYKRIILKKNIRWNHKPSPYPFKEVYEIPLEAPMQDKIIDSAVEEPDNAQLSNTPGGIDLSSGKLHLKVQENSSDIDFSLGSLKDLQSIQVNGILPVIINIAPVTNLPLLLGLSQDSIEEPISKL